MKKRGNIKSQISIEFLIVVGIAFLMTIPLILIFYQQSSTLNTDITSSQVEKVASEIRDAADEVYYLGPPSKKTISIYMPEDVQSVSINNNKIIFLVDSPIGDYQVVKWTVANLSGTMASHTGIHHVTVEAYDTYVDINS
ncbi:hypothetical protein KY348_01455 [Candidatus Woesearchaeota archaeon]|nr:hypothetical protein [Candidatus Woesearchaeota archaeon]